MQKRITGTVGSSDCGVKFSCVAKCPCSKIHTIAPNEAAIDSRFITTALIGRTTERRRRNSARRVIPITNTIARNEFLAMKSIVSRSKAVCPVTSSSPPAGAPIIMIGVWPRIVRTSSRASSLDAGFEMTTPSAAMCVPYTGGFTRSTFSCSFSTFVGCS